MKSDTVKKGIQQAPQSFSFQCTGYDRGGNGEAISCIVCSYNEIVPGHMNLDKITNAVKMGVAMAGGGTDSWFRLLQFVTVLQWDMLV